MKTITVPKTMTILLLCLSLGAPPARPEQGTPQGTQQAIQKEAQQEGQKEAQKVAESPEKPPLRPEELDQLLASIALYPDNLVAQVLSASTYPVEIVQASRFVKENSKLKGDKLMAAAKDKDWDPSVKAMLEFPEVLAMMDEKLEWTTKLGDAFLSQQRDVMDSVQRLRRKANETGNLKTTKEQKVIVEQETQTIVIQPANPQVVYVPTYNPTVVYGAWPYPAYPPYPVYPPGYVATASLFSFAAGVAVGAAWGGWHSDWHGGDVNINANNYNNFTRNNYTNANKYQARQNNQAWQHNPEHRRGAQYNNQATAQRFGESRAGTRGASSSGLRGYEGGAGGRAGGGGAGARDVSRAGGAGAGTRAAPSGGRTSAFSGASSGGADRAASVRGQSSRGSSSLAGGGASRGGGGTARGGGGGRGGGGRGGRR